VIVRVLSALAVLLLVAGAAVAQPLELLEDDAIAQLDEAIVEPAQSADVPRVERAAVPRADDRLPRSVTPARVFRPPR
jgi:hypothetical protein